MEGKIEINYGIMHCVARGNGWQLIPDAEFSFIKEEWEGKPLESKFLGTTVIAKDTSEVIALCEKAIKAHLQMVASTPGLGLRVPEPSAA